MKKVLILGMTSGYGGIESFIMGLFRHFSKRGYQFYFVKTDDVIAYEDELLKESAEIFKITPRRKNVFKHYCELKNIFKNNKFDIVWTNRCTLNSIAEMRYAKAYHCPMRIMHAHQSQNMGSALTGKMHNHNKKQLDKYCTLKFSCSDEATKYFYQDKHDVHLIINGLDVSRYLYDEKLDTGMREKLNLNDSFVIGHVGRFAPEKNQKFVLDIFAQVLKTIPQSYLLFCGKGPLLSECKNYAEQLRIDKRVLFLGEVQNISELLQVLNVFVFPSKFEGLPYAALEAQFSGAKCLISTFVSKDVKVVDDTEFLDIDDPSVWADRVIANHFYKKARHEELINSKFGLENMCVNISKIICSEEEKKGEFS